MKIKILLICLILLTLFFLKDTSSYAFSIQCGSSGFRKQVKCLKEIKNHQVVRQSLDYSCGPAGLATILNYYYGARISEENIIAALLETTDIRKVKERKGFSLLDLKHFSEAVGFKAVGYKAMDPSFLKELNRPVLVPIKFKNYRHFVVIKDVIGDRIFFADPTMGNMSMKACQFAYIWQGGIGLVIEDGRVKHKKVPMLSVKKEDVRLYGYKNIISNLESSVLRTAVYPNEF